MSVKKTHKYILVIGNCFDNLRSKDCRRTN